jgi:hypothetical protein
MVLRNLPQGGGKVLRNSPRKGGMVTRNYRPEGSLGSENRHATELHKALKVLDIAFIAHHQSPVVV